VGKTWKGPERQRASERQAAPPASPTRELSLERARHAVTGNDAYRAQFEADPLGFLNRFGLGHAATNAAAARQLLGGATRHADPGGESRADARLVIARSPIHGEGVFTSSPIAAGQIVSSLVTGDSVSYTASKVNQSSKVNVEPRPGSGGPVLVTTEPVRAGTEIVADYPYPGK
jgi:hypothetical protein